MRLSAHPINTISNTISQFLSIKNEVSAKLMFLYIASGKICNAADKAIIPEWLKASIVKYFSEFLHKFFIDVESVIPKAPAS